MLVQDEEGFSYVVQKHAEEYLKHILEINNVKMDYIATQKKPLK